MKRLLVFLLITTGLAAWAAKPASTSVGTESVKLVAARPLTGVNSWQTATYYKQGSIVVNVKRYYMAVGEGVSSGTPPIHTSGEVSDGGVVWRKIDYGERKGVIVTLQTNGKVYWSLSDYEAEIGKGISTSGIDSGFEFGAEYQGAISVICEEGTVVVGIQEW